MRASREYKVAARRKILRAAERGFRTQGYGGLGVDGLAAEAGVTSGAFYRYFPSKEQAFEEAMVQGLIEYRDRVKEIQSRHGKRWLEVFVTDYLREVHRVDLAGGCIVPGLTADVVRAGKATRAKYQTHLEEVVRAIADGLPRKSIRTARALMMTLSGAVEMSRAVENRTAVLAIRRAAYKAVKSIVGY